MREILFIAVVVAFIIGAAKADTTASTVPIFSNKTRVLNIPVVQTEPGVRYTAQVVLNPDGTYKVDSTPLYCGFSPINPLCNVQ